MYYKFFQHQTASFQNHGIRYVRHRIFWNFFLDFRKSLLYSSPHKLLCIVLCTAFMEISRRSYFFGAWQLLVTVSFHCTETQMLGFSSPQRTLTLTHSYCVSCSISLFSSASLYLSDLVWSGAAVSKGRSKTT